MYQSRCVRRGFIVNGANGPDFSPVVSTAGTLNTRLSSSVTTARTTTPAITTQMSTTSISDTVIAEPNAQFCAVSNCAAII